MNSKFNVCVLISGRGSNFKCLRDSALSYQIAKLISNKSDAAGINYAIEADIPYESFACKDYENLKAQKHAIYAAIRNLNPDLIALAGYMQILEGDFVDEFYGKIINIHPSLLPAYPGLDTHERVLEAGDKISGCTVHFLDKGIDTGPIIAQASCECLVSDDVDSLAARVLVQEHKLYPWVLNTIAKGGISFKDDKVQFTEEAIQEARVNEFALAL